MVEGERGLGLDGQHLEAKPTVEQTAQLEVAPHQPTEASDQRPSSLEQPPVVASNESVGEPSTSQHLTERPTLEEIPKGEVDLIALGRQMDAIFEQPVEHE